MLLAVDTQRWHPEQPTKTNLILLWRVLLLLSYSWLRCFCYAKVAIVFGQMDQCSLQNADHSTGIAMTNINTFQINPKTKHFFILSSLLWCPTGKCLEHFVWCDDCWWLDPRIKCPRGSQTTVHCDNRQATKPLAQTHSITDLMTKLYF